MKADRRDTPYDHGDLVFYYRGAWYQDTLCNEWFTYTCSEDMQPSCRSLIGSLDRFGRGQGVLGAVAQRDCPMLNLTSPLGLNQTTYNIKVPFFESRKNDEAMEKELYGMLEKFNSIPYKDMEAPPLVDTLPDGHVYVLAANNTSVSTLRLSMILAVNDNMNEHYVIFSTE